MTKEEKAIYDKEYRAKNKANRKAYLQANKEKIKKQTAEWYQNNKYDVNKRRKQYLKDYYEANKPKISKRNSVYGRKHREINKDAIQKRINEYRRNRYANDIDYRLRSLLNSKLRSSIKTGEKIQDAEALLGCSISFFKEYIASKFKDGMSWDNHGIRTWHLDHIKPISSFDLTKESEQKKCFHYTNLQPLNYLENIRKRNNIL